MIYSFSKFNYGITINTENNKLNFSEGGPELTITLNSGSYTHDEFKTAVSSGFNSVGGQAYTVTLNRNTNVFTISAPGNFEILLATGTDIAVSFAEMLGFTQVADLTGTNSYSGAEASGYEYYPQFYLQSYVDNTIYQSSVDVTVNRTASGRVEIVRFGVDNFIEMDIKFITDRPMDGNVIKNNPNGLSDAIDFMQYITQKKKFEFVKDASTPNDFVKVILESTPGYADGTGFKLRELFNQNLPDIYETGVIKLRVLD